MRDYLTTREVADYLRLGERKIYELVSERRIPFVRLTGKILFPRRLIDHWVASQAELAQGVQAPPPPVIAGSHDPLLEWAARESECDLALLVCGSMGGLARLAEGAAMAAAAHVLEPASGEYNRAALLAAAPGGGMVLIEWARRRQGLALPAGTSVSLAEALAPGMRFAVRQEGAGARILLAHLAAQAGLAKLPDNGPLAHDENEVAALVADGRADCGLCIEATARRLRLGFLPLAWERFDLAMRRRDYFEPPLQRLLAFTRSPAFAAKAAELGGYDVAGCGTVGFNS